MPAALVWDISASRDSKVARHSAAGPPGAHQPKPKGVGEEEAGPTPEMFRAFIAASKGISQREIADQLGVSQPTVSRFVKRVNEWIAAGNKLPGLDELPPHEPRSRTFSVDPRTMERFTGDDQNEIDDDE
jgi:hypothetical protein